MKKTSIPVSIHKTLKKEVTASRSPTPSAGNRKVKFVNAYDMNDFSLNDKWYYIALLDLTTCSNFKPDNQWMAQRLGITEEEVLFALTQLEKAGLLKVENETYKKIDANLLIPTVSSRKKIREYHKVMSQKAVEVMMSKTSPENFQKRLIQGTTIAANPERLESAKGIIKKALIDVINTLTEGDCTELYHLNLQLFPLLNDEVKNERD